MSKYRREYRDEQTKALKAMTSDQRADLVELLRCGADNIVTNPDDWQSALWNTGVDGITEAVFAEDAVDPSACDPARRLAVLLEAAARVEEGSWP